MLLWYLDLSKNALIRKTCIGGHKEGTDIWQKLAHHDFLVQQFQKKYISWWVFHMLRFCNFSSSDINLKTKCFCFFFFIKSWQMLWWGIEEADVPPSIMLGRLQDEVLFCIFRMWVILISTALDTNFSFPLSYILRITTVSSTRIPLALQKRL